MPPSYVKAYLKRSKNDANDAAAICEAVTRPSMRFVPIKTKEQQTALLLHRARQLLVRQRTMLSNALRGHLAELGVVSAKGRNGIGELLRIIADGTDNRIAAATRAILEVMSRQYSAIGAEIRSIDKSILAWHRSCEASRRLEEIPGIGREAIPLGPQPCRLDRASAEAAFNRRQGQAWQHHQAGQSLLAMAPRRRRDGRHSLCSTARHQAAVAHADHGPPTRKGRRRCSCQ
jgi:hypothetical protein